MNDTANRSRITSNQQEQNALQTRLRHLSGELCPRLRESRHLKCYELVEQLVDYLYSLEPNDRTSFRMESRVRDLISQLPESIPPKLESDEECVQRRSRRLADCALATATLLLARLDLQEFDARITNEPQRSVLCALKFAVDHALVYMPEEPFLAFQHLSPEFQQALILPGVFSKDDLAYRLSRDIGLAIAAIYQHTLREMIR